MKFPVDVAEDEDEFFEVGGGEGPIKRKILY